ncbi:MAG: LpxL/LpxP family Kdo(2)-lipid IV(A) lauroyl/palmitoleoyl acyltransferase [Gammaproteobacteria bacterium]
MKRRRVPLYRFAGPRYWLPWLGIGALRLSILLPWRWQLALGRPLGGILHVVMRKRRRYALANIAVCFPELDESARRSLVRRHFTSLSVSLFEMGFAWWGKLARLRPLAHPEGLEHLRAALAHGRGAILLTGHFTTLELASLLLTQLVPPVDAVYRQNENPLLDEITRRGRERGAEETIPKESVRSMLKTLRRKKALWYAPDQSYRRKQSALVPFFGEPAVSGTATSQLARLSGAPVVPFLPLRLANGSGYRLIVLPALEDFPSDDPVADTLRFHRLLEAHIRKAPEQYYWIHRRFKGRPPEYPDIYP